MTKLRIQKNMDHTRYIIYDGSHDKIKNSFKVYNDGYMCLDRWRSRKVVKIVDHSNIIIAVDHDGCRLFNKSYNQNIEGVGYLCCIVCNGMLYRWYDRGDAHIRMWSSATDNLYKKKLTTRETCSWNSPISLIKYFDVPVNLYDINYGKDIMADYNSRGIKISSGFTDIIIRATEKN